MNEEEVRKIIDNMSEQELNDFIFFALQEVEKENQKLKTELEKKDKQIEEFKEIDEKRTWTVNNVIAEYIPDYELISLVNRYKDESFIPRVEVEKILNDRKK